MSRLFVWFLILMCSQLVVAEMSIPANIVKVKGAGSGETEELALKDAYRDAVESAVGMFVDAEQMVKNDELIKDEILTQSNAYIEEYDVIAKSSSDGVVKIKILARVKKQALTKKIEGVMPAKTIKLGGGLKKFHAVTTTQGKRSEDGSALLDKALEGVDPVAQLLDVTLACSEGVPMPALARSLKYGQKTAEQEGLVEIAYLFKFEINKKRYFEEFIPKLNQTLEQVSIEQPAEVVFSVERSCSGRLNKLGEDYRVADVRHMIDRLRNGMFDGALSFESVLTGRMGNRETSSFHCDPDPLDVVVVTEANDSMTMVKGRRFMLDEAMAQIVRNWRCGLDSGDKATRRKVARLRDELPTYRVSFLDDKGNALVAKEIGFQRMGGSFRDSLSCEGIFGKAMTGGKRKSRRCGTPSDIGEANKVWMIAPLLGADKQSYYQWYSFKLPKEELPKIDSIKIELVQ